MGTYLWGTSVVFLNPHTDNTLMTNYRRSVDESTVTAAGAYRPIQQKVLLDNHTVKYFENPGSVVFHNRGFQKSSG